ncbi:helix-turn-helix transcriptional regulator [Salinactinospora qingdaonensis]|uniref:Helix-turn-helix transcriptional regulator n=2 Tax=Salinactinospora qingdaonensis TaxID=702744 RepID=A0ABP7G414_9ACTN
MNGSAWQRWGHELRRHREAAALTQRKLASETFLSPATISSFENGTRSPRHKHAEDMDKILNAGGELLQLWSEITNRRDIPERWRKFEAVEQDATEIKEFHNAVIPGLLQTPGYAESILRNTKFGKWEDAELKKLVNSRVSRLPSVEGADLSFVLDEQAIRRVVGSRAIHRDQLSHLHTLVEKQKIRLGIIPLYTPSHPNPTGPFRVISLQDGRMIGHEEHRSGMHVVTGPEANRMSSIFGSLQAEALPTSQTIELLSEIGNEINGQ